MLLSNSYSGKVLPSSENVEQMLEDFIDQSRVFADLSATKIAISADIKPRCTSELKIAVQAPCHKLFPQYLLLP